MNRLGRTGGFLQRVSCRSTPISLYHQLPLTINPARGPLSEPSDKSCHFRTQFRSASSQEKAKALNQQGIDSQLSDYDAKIHEQKEKQRATPWHREGSEDPPVRRQRSAGAMTKGEHTQS